MAGDYDQWREAPGQAVRLSQVIGALSFALDLTEGQPAGHCMRCCWLGFRLGERIVLSESALRDLYFTLLLKDAGCSSNAERLFELYACDERAAKHDWLQVNSDSIENVARFVFKHAAPGRGLHTRLAYMFNLLRRGARFADEVVSTRCERGASIARTLGFGDRVADAIRGLDEHWDGKGRPLHEQGRVIPLGSRIALLAQVADVFYQTSGMDGSLEELQRRRGTWFDPALVDSFTAMAKEPGFWEPLHVKGFEQRVWDLEPGGTLLPLDDGRLDAIALAFAQVVDAKSHFTYGHSERVGYYSDVLARELGMGEGKRRTVRRAGLLHDLGKLGVSNALLDKPGRLTAQEWVQMKRHPAHSEMILARIAPFQALARIAGAHHERLDGMGYPRGLCGEDIPLESRVVTTADVFDALTSERPYRRALPLGKALGIMEKDRGLGLDTACLDALYRCVPELTAGYSPRQAVGLTQGLNAAQSGNRDDCLPSVGLSTK